MIHTAWLSPATQSALHPALDPHRGDRLRVDTRILVVLDVVRRNDNTFVTWSDEVGQVPRTETLVDWRQRACNGVVLSARWPT